MNEFIVKNGLIVHASSYTSGSGSASLYPPIGIDVTSAHMHSSWATGVNSGDQYILDSFPTASGNTAKWLISITDGTNFKSSDILCVWNGLGNTTFSEYTTNAIGDVPGFLSTNVTSGNMNLVAFPQTGSWSVKMLRFII